MAKKNDSKSKSNEKKEFETEMKDSKKKRSSGRHTFKPSDRARSSSYGGNDLSWYTRNADLVDSAARIPYPYVPGMNIVAVPRHVNDDFEAKGTTFEYKVPGIISLNFYPTIGRSMDISSPANIAAREMYARVRSKYSGSLEADAPDIMMYALAVDSLYMLYEDMKRAYYVINSVTPYNRLYPKYLLAAMGWKYEDLLDNRTLMYQRLCEMNALLKKFMIPDDMDLYKRHQFMVANVYADTPDVKSQNYVFKCSGFYQLTNTETMTTLEMKDWHTDIVRMELEDAWTFWREAYDALALWDTAYTINGYLERAYQDSTFLIPSPVIEDGLLQPVFNAEVLTQIHNATVVKVSKSSLNVTQDPIHDNVLLSKPKSEYADYADDWHGVRTYQVVPTEVLIDFKGSTTPGTGDNIIATRLCTVSVPGEDPASADSYYLSCGTEIIEAMYMYDGTVNTGEAFPIAGSHTAMENIYAPGSQGANQVSAFLLKSLAYLSTFDMHPIISLYYRAYDGDGGYYNWFIPFGVQSNVTNVDGETIDNLHRMCIYSEFNAFR